jgi:BirA family biotin operon repressor/biotin-[acetyl-CoA-carboxylase] ligase
VQDISTAPILWFDELDSTNAEARRRAEAGESGPLWIAARRQTAGRGRRGRAWETGEGSLAATLLTSVDAPPAEAAQLSFVAALAIRDLARAYVPEELIGLKWPNDVLLARAKLSGALIESGRRDGGLWLAIGVGVNLKSAPVGLGYPAAALGDHLRPGLTAPTPEEALERLRGAFADWAGLWSREGFEPLRRRWTEAAVGLGGRCVARLGERTLEGEAEGLDADGALLLRLASGRLERITAGDVFFGNEGRLS